MLDLWRDRCRIWKYTYKVSARAVRSANVNLQLKHLRGAHPTYRTDPIRAYPRVSPCGDLSDGGIATHCEARVPKKAQKHRPRLATGRVEGERPQVRGNANAVAPKVDKDTAHPPENCTGRLGLI
jgi:hypothetical protein